MKRTVPFLDWAWLKGILYNDRFRKEKGRAYGDGVLLSLVAAVWRSCIHLLLRRFGVPTLDIWGVVGFSVHRDWLAIGKADFVFYKKQMRWIAVPEIAIDTCWTLA